MACHRTVPLTLAAGNTAVASIERFSWGAGSKALLGRIPAASGNTGLLTPGFARYIAAASLDFQSLGKTTVVAQHVSESVMQEITYDVA